MVFSLSFYACILDPGAVLGAEDGAWIDIGYILSF
jgi:hypothetical protein